MIISKQLNFKLSELIICLMISVSSFLPKIVHLFPENIASIGFFNFSISAGLFGDIQFYFWIILVKISLIIILVTWFLTCKHWWRFVILVPLIIELIKLISIFSNQFDDIDEIDYIYSLPITIPIILILIYISNKLNKHLYYLSLNNEIDEIFNEINNNENHTEIIEEFKQLKARKHHLDDTKYLNYLLGLRNKIYKS